MTVLRRDSELWKRLVRARGITGRVLVGVPADRGGDGYPNSSATLAQVAQWNHDGTSTIPARPFLAGPLDGRKRDLQQVVAKVAQAIMQDKITAARGLSLLGQWARDRVIKAITSHIPPPNAQSTIARKGSSTPLIDTGQLKGSITYEVEGLDE